MFPEKTDKTLFVAGPAIKDIQVPNKIVFNIPVLHFLHPLRRNNHYNSKVHLVCHFPGYPKANVPTGKNCAMNAAR